MAQSKDHEELLNSAEIWDRLAKAQDEQADYYESRGEYAGTSHNRAQTYRDTAKSLRMQAEDGVPRCVCHLLTFDQCRALSQALATKPTKG